jgi:hypothetical protein
MVVWWPVMWLWSGVLPFLVVSLSVCVPASASRSYIHCPAAPSSVLLRKSAYGLNTTSYIHNYI